MARDARALRKKFFQKRIPEYRKNPVLFAKEVLLFEPDEWQQEALMDLAQNPKVAIKSGQGVGKTGLEAVALLWFLCCFPYPRIVATAPTKQQLHDVLWSEVSKWMNRSPLLSAILKWTKTYIYMIGYEKRWFAVARTATKPENMQGFHENKIMHIEEIQEVPHSPRNYSICCYYVLSLPIDKSEKWCQFWCNLVSDVS